MVFLKRQVEEKNGNEYENFYFYHGNTYLGKAEDGLSSIQANIKDELGETVDPEKIEKLQEEAREKMETEVKDNSEDDVDLDLDLNHWNRAKKRENKSHIAVWEFANDRDVTVEIIEQDDGQEGKYYDVLEKVGGYTEHEIATAVMDVEKAVEEAEGAMLTANENKAEMADSGYAYEKFEPDVSDEMVEDAQDVSVKNWEWVDPEENMVEDQEEAIARWENTEVDSPITDGNVQINTHTTPYTRDRDQARVQKFTTVLNADSPGEMSRRNYESFSSALNRAENWMQDHPEASADGFSDSGAEYEMSDSEQMIASGEDLEEMVVEHPSIIEDQWNIEASGNTVEVSHKEADISASLEIIERTDRHDETFYEYAIAGNLVEEYSPDVDIINLTTKKHSFVNLDYIVGDLAYLMSQAEEDYEEDSSSVKSELSDIEAKPPEIGDEFYHVRVRDPSKYETERVPDWASDVASSVSKGSKVKMGKLGQSDWEVQSVMIKKSNVDRKKAKDLAEEIAMKIDNSDSEMKDSGNPRTMSQIKEYAKDNGWSVERYSVMPRNSYDRLLVEKNGVELNLEQETYYTNYDYYIEKNGETVKTFSTGVSGDYNKSDVVKKMRQLMDLHEDGDISLSDHKSDFSVKSSELKDPGVNVSAGDFIVWNSGGTVEEVKSISSDSIKLELIRDPNGQDGIHDIGDTYSIDHEDLREKKGQYSIKDTYSMMSDSGKAISDVEQGDIIHWKSGGTIEKVMSVSGDSIKLQLIRDPNGEDGIHDPGDTYSIDHDDLEEKSSEFKILDSDDSMLQDSDTDIFAGDEFADRIANSELIYQDWDEDNVANIDDRSPLEPGDAEEERVNDEILLSEELKNIEELSENHREVYEMLKDEVDIHKGRVKQPESILKKLHEKYSEEVTDIIGVTIMADDKDEVMQVAQELKDRHALFPIGEERADENHYEEDGFYRAYHLIIEVEHDGEKYPAEVQIKTEEQAKLQELAHPYYKDNSDMPEVLVEKARQLESGEIDSVDVDEIKKKLPPEP